MAAYQFVFASFAFILGACIGSFLNVVIYRMPRGLSVDEPKRSFCPTCNKTIPLTQNIPLFTWLWQRGKAVCCGTGISPRYFVVELLTALLFLAIWLVQNHENAPILAPGYWILAAMLVAGSFIDFEHYIIPDEITWGLTGLGLIFSFIVPPLMDVGPAMVNPLTFGFDERIQALGFSAFGAIIGYGTVRSIVEAGKLLFGKKQVKLEKPMPFHWVRKGDDATLKIGEEDPDQWSEMFSRKSDRLILICDKLEVGGETFENVQPKFSWEKMYLGEREWALDKLDEMTGEVKELVIPREAMGLGDVKLMAGIGAFLGWEAVYFSIFAASIIGCVVTLIAVLAKQRRFSQQIPFGPYLALGALIWMFVGWKILNWYLGFMRGPDF